MKHYIDKDALAAELERRTDELYALLPDSNGIIDGSITISTEDACNTGKYVALESIRKYIDTLEVKEVDLETNIQDYINSHFTEGRDGGIISDWYKVLGGIHYNDLKEFAKHFFELGLSVSNSTKVTTPDIEDVLKENGVNPYSKEAKIIKESYYMALEKLKAQKGEKI